MNVQQIANLLTRGARVTFEQLLRDVLAPAHMQEPWSRKWFGVFGAFAEMIWQGTQEALDVGFVDTCPGDALDYVGFNENIERLLDEPGGTYRDRLRDPWTQWEESGTLDGIGFQLSRYGVQVQDIAVYDLAAGWDPGDTADWNQNEWDHESARLWGVCTHPTNWSPLIASENLIASEELVAGVAGMTQTDYRNIRRIFHKWRSEHASPVSLYIIYSGTLASLSAASMGLLLASQDAVELPITWPWASEGLIAGESVVAGFYIDPQ